MTDFSNLLDATEEFMRRAGQLDRTGFATATCDELREFRRNLLSSEYSEYLEAEHLTNELAAVVQELLDVIVVAWGSVLAYVGPERARRAAAEVARANLDKVIGEGLPIKRADGKVLKPEGWRPPDIAGVLQA